MKLNHLRDVLAVAERGSLRAAARHLGVAQPALTRSIQELERELGIPLFERQPTGVTVTPMGQLFVRRANAVRVELQRAREEIDQVRGGTNGRLSVCLSTVPHIALMPYALPAFRARYPYVHLDLAEGLFPMIETSLRSGIIDVYIGPPPAGPPSPDLLVQVLFANTRVILGRKGHPLANARSLRELIDAQWLSTSIFVKLDEELAPLFAEHGLSPPRMVVQAHSALTMLVAITYSDLLGMLPVQWTEFPMTRDALQRIHVAEPLPAPPICIVRRTGLPLTPAGEYFCDMMLRASGHMKAAKSPRPKLAPSAKSGGSNA
ncbi:MAG: LysR substrate-binding domain-containing protein [Usitatibacter sp.]